MTEETKSNQEAINAVVEQRKQRIEGVVSDRIGKLTARRESYRRIRDMVVRDITEYYDRYPDRALDDRARDEEDYLVRGLRSIFTILDDYIISFKTEDEPRTTLSGKPIFEVPKKESA